MVIKVIFENEDFLVVDKPSGLVVNRSETTQEETLQDQLSKYFKLAPEDLGIGGRVGIVHRLDRETSGLLVVAKTQNYFDFMQGEFKKRRVKKEYFALVHGLVADDFGVISESLGRVGKFGKFGIVDSGRESVTEFNVINRFQRDKNWIDSILNEADVSLSRPRLSYLKANALFYSQLKLTPKTGRTHQIRVHLKSIGHPIVSDLIYTPSKLIKFDLLWCPRLFLHSARLSFYGPNSKKNFDFKSDLPNDLKRVILSLSK